MIEEKEAYNNLRNEYKQKKKDETNLILAFIWSILKTIFYFGLIILVSIAVVQKCNAQTTYFVSNGGNDVNNGTSSVTPWKTIAKINAHAFNPKDSILFQSGGTWAEQLTMPSSGTLGNNIIFASYGAGAQPIITGSNTRANTINFNNKSFVTVYNLECRNATPSILKGSINVGNSTTQGIVIRKCLIDSNRMSGVYIDGSTLASDFIIDSCTIQNNGEFGILENSAASFTTGQISNNQVLNNGWASAADGQQISGIQGNMGNLNIFGNNIFNSAPGVASANDQCHGIYISTATTAPANIYNNTIHGNSNGAGIKARFSANIYGNIIYSNRLNGISAGGNGTTNTVLNVYQNIFYGSTAGFPGLGCVALGTGTYSVRAINNTFYQDGSSPGAAEVSTVSAPNLTNFTFLNNIVFLAAGQHGLNLFTPTNKDTVDYNIYWQTTQAGAPNNQFNGATQTWAQWQALGFDAHGKNVDPQLNNPTADFSLKSTSPAIGAALNEGFGSDIGAVPFSNIIYVATTGNDLTGNGSFAKPFATLHKACSVAVFPQSISVLAGTFTETLHCILAPGVSITGVDTNTTHIQVNYYNASAVDGLILLQSTTENTSGNQTIQNIDFKVLSPDSVSTFICIIRRGNDTIRNCKFTGALNGAVYFYGETTADSPPTTYSQHNAIYNCHIYDCHDRQSTNTRSAGGSIGMAGQQTMTIHDNVAKNINKPQLHNGDIIGATHGYNKDIQIYNDSLYKNIVEGNSNNFIIEEWFDQGGWNVYNNYFSGGGNAIDIGVGGANKGAYPYSFWVHQNTFISPTQVPTYPLQSLAISSMGVQFETESNANSGYALIDSNTFTNMGTAFQVTLTHDATEKLHNVKFYNNLATNMGYADGGYGGFMVFLWFSLGTGMDSILIDNNTLIGSTGAGKSQAGLYIVDNHGGSNFFFRNNIVENTNPSGYVTFAGSKNITCTLQNNDAFNCAFTNNTQIKTTTDGTPTVTFTANSGNIKVDPLLDPTFHLKAGSLCIDAGINTGYIPFQGAAPDMGAFETSASQQTPTITWSNQTITYGITLSTLNVYTATANTPGTFSYNISGTPNAGVYNSFTVTFTPTDQLNWTSATKTVTLTVTQSSIPATISGLSVSYNAAPQNPIVTSTPTIATNILLNGVSGGRINAGSYTYTISSGDPNYIFTGQPLSGTFTINKAIVVITISNTSQTYTGSPLPVTVTTNPNVSGISVTYNGSSTVPTSAGSYTVIASLVNANYTATNDTVTYVINKANPVVRWATPSPITYGTALNGTQLNATANVAGTFTYTPVSGTILNAGTQTLSVNFTPTDNTDYNSINNTTVQLVVNQATATISLSNLNQTYDGTGKSATVTTNPAGLNVITITYNGSSTLPINAGSYAVSATLANSNYTASPASGTLVIAKAVATITLSGLTVTYNGSPVSVTATTAPAGLTVVSITYNGSSTPPTSAGSYPIVASLNNANYQATNAVGTLVINKATPIITWSNPAAITYGTALSATQLNATSGGVAGTFTYNPASGTILNAGTWTLSVNFTPTDATDYNSVNGTTVTLVVNQATATITLSNLSQIFDGNPKPVTVTTNPIGLGVIAVTYNGSGTAPLAVGSYAVVATLTNSNYTATPANGTLVISSSPANIFITNLSQTYTGSPLPVTVTTSPPGLTNSVTYNGSVTVPTNAGTYTVIATIIQTGHSGADTEIYVINKANPVISWSNPSAITYGTALSGTQLNASTATAGSFVYTPPSGTILNAGTQTLSVAFTPTDASNYNSVPVTTVQIVVNKATATLTATNLSQVFDGTQKSVTVTTAPSGLSVISVTYNGSSTPPSAVGSYTVIVNLTNSNYTATPDTVTLVITSAIGHISISNLLQTYTASPLPVTVTTNPNGLTFTLTYNGSGTTPTVSGSYIVIATLTGGTFTGADTETYVINKAQSIITWSNPASITYGTTLSSTQLNATANVVGTFVYAPPSGALLSAGTQNLSVSFTATDTNYLGSSKIVTIIVNKATATLSLSNLNQVYDSTKKYVIITVTPSGLSGVTVTYNGTDSFAINVGSYVINVSLTNSNYTATPISGTLVISKATAILTYPAQFPIVVGTPLTAINFNATSSKSGVFTYNYLVGKVLPTGRTTLTATFHPTNLNYNVSSISTSITIYGASFIEYYIIKGRTIYLNYPK